MKKYIAKFKKQSNFATQVVAVVLIVLLVNVVSYQLFWRWDLTENNRYSLSEASIELAQELDDVLNITVYASAELPPQMVVVRQALIDVLSDYKTYAGSNLQIDYIDPQGDEKLEQRLMLDGIQKVQFNVMSNESYEISAGYLGVKIAYADATEIIPFVSDPNGLELQLTGAMARVVDNDIPVVGFVSGQGEHTLTEGLGIINQALSGVYDLRTIDLVETTEIADDVDALVIAGAQEEYSEAQRYALDQFIMRGGSLLVLQAGVTVDLEMLQASANEGNINALIEPYGFSVGDSFVLDTRHEPGSFNGGGQPVTLPYPFFVMVTRDSFNAENPIVSGLQQVIFPWSSPVTLNEEKGAGTLLAETTADAWLMRENYNLNPQGNFGFQEDPAAYTLAAMRTGNITSAFAEKPAGAAGEHVASTENGSVVVIGGSRFITDTFVSRYPQNGVLFQNMVDFLASERNLISIRNKQAVNPPLAPLEESAKARLKYLNIYGITALVILFGLARYRLRKRRTS